MKTCAMTACNRTVEGKTDYCDRHACLCLIPGCESHARTKQLCNTHYNNSLRKQTRTGSDQFCVMPGCYALKERNGFFCPPHERVAQEYIAPQPCLVPWCEEMAINGYFCETHHDTYHQTGGPERTIRLCGVEGCGESHDVKGLCQKHYAQFKRSYDRRVDDIQHEKRER